MKAALLFAAALILPGGCDEGATATPLVGDADASASSDTADASGSNQTLDDMAADGWSIQAAQLRPFYIEDCAKLTSCFGNNATSPYGLWYLPPAPGETIDSSVIPEGAQLPPDAEGRYAAWQLREDEALVFVGKTPPPVRYFSFTPYLFTRADGSGEHVPVFASLTDALNMTTLGPDTHGTDIAVIMTASGEADARIRRSLTDGGLDAAAIHTLPLDGSVLRMGLTPNSDTLMMLQRFALFDDETAGRAYLDDPQALVFRVTPGAAAAINQLPVPARAERVSGTSEIPLEAPLDVMESAILAAYDSASSVTKINVIGASLVTAFLSPEDCIANLTNCLGEVSDTIYATGPLPPTVAPGGASLNLGDTPGERIIAFGANHVATGRATYSNVVVMNTGRLAGVASFTSDAMPGSAATWLPDDPDVDKLFAVSIMRDCGDEPYCVEVPTDFPGVGLDEPIGLIFRAYVQPGASVSAVPSELVVERMVHVVP